MKMPALSAQDGRIPEEIRDHLSRLSWPNPVHAGDTLDGRDPAELRTLVREGLVKPIFEADPETLRTSMSYVITPEGCRVIGVKEILPDLEETWCRPYGDRIRVWRSKDGIIAGKRGALEARGLDGVARRAATVAEARAVIAAANRRYLGTHGRA